MQDAAGTRRYENRCAGWRVPSPLGRDEGWLPYCRERGTSPSPREVFGRATFPRPHLSWIPAIAGITTVRGLYGVFRFKAETRPVCQRLPQTIIFVPITHGRLAPAHQGMKTRSCHSYAANSHRGFCHAPPPAPAGDKPPRYISPSPPLWIPAFAGMTIVRMSLFSNSGPLCEAG